MELETDKRLGLGPRLTEVLEPEQGNHLVAPTLTPRPQQ